MKWTQQHSRNAVAAKVLRTKEEAVQARLSAQRGSNWGDLHTI